MNATIPCPIPLPIAKTVRTADSLPRLDARLLSALDFVRGGTVADVGTDHAYLPLTLLLRDRCAFAVASDIHRGPAECAAHNLGAFGIGSDKAAVLCTDGLHGVKEYRPTDIIIYGMGGEMIIHILKDAPWVKNGAVRLILQPMTKQSELREYLGAEGFATVGERLVCTDRIYQVICVEYDGVPRTYSRVELLVGADNIRRKDPLLPNLIDRRCDLLQTAIDGKKKADVDTADDLALLNELKLLRTSIL